MTDWALFIVGLLIPLCGVLTWMYADAEREVMIQRNRAEEAETWLLLADEEIEAVRLRLAESETRRRQRSQAVCSLPLHRISLTPERLEEMRN